MHHLHLYDFISMRINEFKDEIYSIHYYPEWKTS